MSFFSAIPNLWNVTLNSFQGLEAADAVTEQMLKQVQHDG